MTKKIQLTLQNEVSECSLACLAMVCSAYGRQDVMLELRHTVSVSGDGMSVFQLALVAGRLGLVTRALRLEMAQLDELQLPCILFWKNSHFVVLESRSHRSIDICDPALGRVSYTRDEVAASFSGIALEVTPGQHFDPKARPSASASNPFLFRTILSRARGLAPYLVPMAALSILANIVGIISPKLFSITIDEVIGKNDSDFLELLVYVFGLIFLTQAVLTLLRTHLRFRLQSALMYDLPSRLYDWVLRLPLATVERRPVPDIQRKLSAVQHAHLSFTSGWIDLGIEAIFAALFLLMMFLSDAVLSAVILCIFSVYLLARLLSLPILERMQTKIMQSEIERETNSLETLTNFEQLKIQGNEGIKTSQWQNAHSLVVGAHVSQDALEEYLRVFHNIMLNACTLAVAYLGATAVLEGKGSVGALMAFMLYKESFMRLVLTSIDRFVALRMINVEINRSSDLSSAAPEVRDGPSVRELKRSDVRVLSIELAGASYRPGTLEEPIFADLDISVEKGQKLALVGKSGSGKTTILRAMLGLTPLSSGALRINGIPLSNFGPTRFRDRIGYVGSSPAIIDGTVLENIVLDVDLYDSERAQAAIQQVGLHADIDGLPAGFLTRIGQSGVRLSAGQQQRLMLARALYKNPDVLMLDEPTSHLDDTSKAIIIETLSRFEGLCIFASHDPELIAICSRRLSVAALANPADVPETALLAPA